MASSKKQEKIKKNLERINRWANKGIPIVKMKVGKSLYARRFVGAKTVKGKYTTYDAYDGWLRVGTAL